MVFLKQFAKSVEVGKNSIHQEHGTNKLGVIHYMEETLSCGISILELPQCLHQGNKVMKHFDLLKATLFCKLSVSSLPETWTAFSALQGFR